MSIGKIGTNLTKFDKVLSRVYYICIMTSDTSIVETSSSVEKVPKVTNPYLTQEYQKFIQIIKDGKIPEHWEILAETLGVSRKTISEWKTMPEFADAINSGLDRALREMEKTGGKDWRQWRERVAILSREKKADNNITLNAEKVVAILGGVTSAEKDPIVNNEISHNNENDKNVPE